MPELGEGDGKCLTSLVGLAPWSRDSGRQRGYRAIRGRGRCVGPVHVSLVDPKQEQRPGAFLPTATKASGIGGSDAETTSTVARHSSTGNSMGGGLRPSHLKTLDNQTQILRRRPESRGVVGAPFTTVKSQREYDPFPLGPGLRRDDEERRPHEVLGAPLLRLAVNK